jgi:hypothetical protein
MIPPAPCTGPKQPTEMPPRHLALARAPSQTSTRCQHPKPWLVNRVPWLVTRKKGAGHKKKGRRTLEKRASDTRKKGVRRIRVYNGVSADWSPAICSSASESESTPSARMSESSACSTPHSAHSYINQQVRQRGVKPFCHVRTSKGRDHTLRACASRTNYGSNNWQECVNKRGQRYRPELERADAQNCRPHPIASSFHLVSALIHINSIEHPPTLRSRSFIRS